jgi:hypothetical protein
VGDVPEASAAVREPRVSEVGEGSSSVERESDWVDDLEIGNRQKRRMNEFFAMKHSSVSLKAIMALSQLCTVN